MFEITALDNYRYGLFDFKGEKIRTPSILEHKDDMLFLQDVSIQKPHGFSQDMHKVDLTTAPFMRIPFHTPYAVAERMTEANLAILENEKYDCIPLSITRHPEIDSRIFDSLFEAAIFFFPRCEEKRLVESVITLRKDFGATMFFTQCLPHEIPVYLLLGFDLFDFSEENRKALQTFRENPTKHFVEKEANSSVHTKRILRFMYSHYEDFEIYTKKKGEREIYISSDSLFRPEVERFRRAVVERYTPSTNLLVLFPCSARKPYSSSVSHLKFIKAMREGARKNFSSITQLILTSPLGVVPRELEDVVNYDTVVTGFWTQEEIIVARKMLEAIVSKVGNPKIIAHLPKEYRVICKGIDGIIYSCEDDPTSKKSLERLSEVVRDTVSDSCQRRNMEKDKIRKISEFMFAEDIFPQAFHVKGRWVKKIIADRRVLATYDRFLYPTLQGACRMNHYWVNIDFRLRGDVFCAGILDADENIRAGDIVCVRKDGDTCGVGKAVLPSSLMKKMKHGKAVVVKHKL